MKDETLEQYILMSRIPQRRRKVRAQRQGFDKKLRRLYKEWLTLRIQINNLYESIDPPLQKGWKKQNTFVLRADVLRSKDGPFFQRIVDKINAAKPDWKEDYRFRQKRKSLDVHTRELERVVWTPDIENLRFTPKEKKFIQRSVIHRAIVDRGPTVGYVFTEPWRILWIRQPNMIIKIRRKDAELERRRDEIENYLCRNGLWDRAEKLLGHRSYKLHVDRHPSPLANKPLHKILDDEHYAHQTMTMVKTREAPGFFNLPTVRNIHPNALTTHPAGIEPAQAIDEDGVATLEHEGAITQPSAGYITCVTLKLRASCAGCLQTQIGTTHRPWYLLDTMLYLLSYMSIWQKGEKQKVPNSRGGSPYIVCVNNYI